MRVFLCFAIALSGTGLFTLFRGAYWIVWSNREPESIPAFAMLLLPTFWFSSLVLWLIGIEWRSRHFGESSEQVRLLYGTPDPGASKPKPASRAEGNVFLVFLALWLLTMWLPVFDGSLPGPPHSKQNISTQIVWFTVFAPGVLFLKRKSVLEWSRQSRVTRNLFWFALLAGLGYLFAFAAATGELWAEHPAAAAQSALLAVVSLPLILTIRRKFLSHPPAPVLLR